jgi:hypothetical protein
MPTETPIDPGTPSAPTLKEHGSRGSSRASAHAGQRTTIAKTQRLMIAVGSKHPKTADRLP